MTPFIDFLVFKSSSF